MNKNISYYYTKGIMCNVHSLTLSFTFENDGKEPSYSNLCKKSRKKRIDNHLKSHSNH